MQASPPMSIRPLSIDGPFYDELEAGQVLPHGRNQGFRVLLRLDKLLHL